MSQVLLPLTLQDSGIESIPLPPPSRYSREVALEIIWNSFPPLCKWVLSPKLTGPRAQERAVGFSGLPSNPGVSDALGRDRAGRKAGLGEASVVEERAFFHLTNMTFNEICSLP